MARARVAALVGAALFGTSTPAAKALMGAIDPWALASLLYLGSGIALGLGLALGDWRARSQLHGRDFTWLAASVTAGGMIAPLFLVFGLARTSASSASIALALEAPFTALGAWALFGEHVSRSAWTGLLLATAGAMVLALPGISSDVDPIGVGAVALACAGWALDNNLTREIAHADARTIAAWKGFVGAATSGLFAWWRGAHAPDLPHAIGACLVGALGYGVSLALIVIALRGIGAARMSGYFATAPLFGAGASVLLLGDSITGGLCAATLLVALGVRALVFEGHSHLHRHEALEHTHEHDHDEHHQHEHAGNEGAAPHSHFHRHEPLEHEHPHAPDLHHRHVHGLGD